MKTLLTLSDSDMFPGALNLDPATFSLRHAARAVLLDDAGRVALLKVGKDNYHKLPGGGVEKGEDMQLALRRELREETGCHAEIIKEVGEIIELKNQHEEKQISHCWLAKQVGEAEPSRFTDKEVADGFEIIWAASLDDAISLLEQDEPTSYTGTFIRRRDLRFLEAAKALL